MKYYRSATLYISSAPQAHILFLPLTSPVTVEVCYSRDRDGRLIATIDDGSDKPIVLTTGSAKRAMTYPVKIAGGYATRKSLERMFWRAQREIRELSAA